LNVNFAIDASLPVLGMAVGLLLGLLLCLGLTVSILCTSEQRGVSPCAFLFATNSKCRAVNLVLLLCTCMSLLMTTPRSLLAMWSVFVTLVGTDGTSRLQSSFNVEAGSPTHVYLQVAAVFVSAVWLVILALPTYLHGHFIHTLQEPAGKDVLEGAAKGPLPGNGSSEHGDGTNLALLKAGNAASDSKAPARLSLVLTRGNPMLQIAAQRKAEATADAAAAQKLDDGEGETRDASAAAPRMRTPSHLSTRSVRAASAQALWVGVGWMWAVVHPRVWWWAAVWLGQSVALSLVSGLSGNVVGRAFAAMCICLGFAALHWWVAPLMLPRESRHYIPLSTLAIPSLRSMVATGAAANVTVSIVHVCIVLQAVAGYATAAWTFGDLFTGTGASNPFLQDMVVPIDALLALGAAATNVGFFVPLVVCFTMGCAPRACAAVILGLSPLSHLYFASTTISLEEKQALLRHHLANHNEVARAAALRLRYQLAAATTAMASNRNILFSRNKTRARRP
jgi:hypothetical protein